MREPGKAERFYRICKRPWRKLWRHPMGGGWPSRLRGQQRAVRRASSLRSPSHTRVVKTGPHYQRRAPFGGYAGLSKATYFISFRLATAHAASGGSAFPCRITGRLASNSRFNIFTGTSRFPGLTAAYRLRMGIWRFGFRTRNRAFGWLKSITRERRVWARLGTTFMESSDIPFPGPAAEVVRRCA